MNTLKQPTIDAFKQYFHCNPMGIVRAPGRVNLIGEHTDYNDGFVFPLALDRAIWVAFTPRDDYQIHIMANNFNNEFEQVDLSALEKSRHKKSWHKYVRGMAWVLQNAFKKPLKGFDAVINSDIPIGAGLSSSAAAELSIARVLATVNNLTWDPVQMALYAQQAENQWVGVKCGIMDQLISATGVKNHAVLIDCRDLSYEAVPLPENTAVVIMDTGTRRGLVDSAYNERRQQCEDAAELLGVKKLRDVTLDQLFALETHMPKLVFQRAHHVISENARTVAARDAMKKNDAKKMGELMRASHKSLQHDFAVSSAALDIMVNHANVHPACYGARMTGAGFGGCAVALIAADQADDFATVVSAAYQAEAKQTPSLYVCHAEKGVELITL